MAKPGWLLPALGGAATLATAGAAAPALLGAEGAALGAGEAGLLGAGEAAGLGGTAATVGELSSGLTADALLAAPTTAATAGELASSVPLAAGSAALTGAGDVTGLLGSTAGSGISTAAQLAGDAISAAGSDGGAILGVPGTIPSESNLLTGTLEGGGAVETGAPATNPGLGTGFGSWWGGGENPNEYFSQWWKPESQGWLDKAGDWFSRNQGWLKPAVAGGGLAMSIGRNTGTIPGSGPVTQAAKDATTEGAFLTGQANQNLGALNTGALPAGAQSAIDNATRSAKATVRSQYASMGMHAPPAALAAVDQQAAALKLAEADKLVKLGVEEAGTAKGYSALASADYNLLMRAELDKNKDLADSIARFAAALA